MTNSRPMTTVKVPGYQITQKLYEGTRTLVYRGIRATDGQTVVFKFMRNEYPSFNELLHFRNQYTITKNLNLPGVVKSLSLETYGNGYALVMEDTGAISLDKYDSLDLETSLKIVIQIADILHTLYQNRIIHKDIKPANILIHPQTQQVKLIDFSIASVLPFETQEIKNPNVLEGTLAYISPEQTGRMNRGIDYRSDFYSLGVMFFEMLNGKLPFDATDPMELIHCHLTKTPEVINSQIPNPLVNIIQKLMAKNAEDRYQNALGLKYDLEKCLSQWEKLEKIENFKLGEWDISDRFLIPEKLYGREKEVQQLLAAFVRVASPQEKRVAISPHSSHQSQSAATSGLPSFKSEASSGLPLSQGDRRGISKGDGRRTKQGGGSEMMLVAGFSGIGKTAVVNEVHKPITRQQGYFIKGKFDQFNRNIPLSAFVQAFKDLIGQLNCESDAQLSQWQGKILETVGENGQVLIEVIPELESIIGQQPSVAELSGSAAQNRFNQLFQKFVKVFTTVEHPLVIFLDDLQWADSASLQLIKLLMNDSHYLLMLGAYRDNEVSATHPFILTVAELKKAEAIVNTITLQPLTFKDTNHLIADTLNCSTQLAQPLTELINRKTKGNPFFTTQFLKALQVDGHITFNPERCYWECDIVQVNTLALTDDVVEFMAMQLQKFPAETQQVLKLAACIGNSFDLNTLAIVSEQSPTDVATALWKALQEGLILPKTQVYKFFQGLEQFKTEDTVNPKYRFLHDRVQQAAYSLIPDEQKQATHLKIGQLLLKNSSDSDREEKLFDIVNHLNIAQSLITQAFEREQLAELNLAAGRKAKSAIAYSAAIAYLTTGIELLEDNCWRSQYPLTLALHEATAEAMYLTAVFAQLDTIVNTTLKSAHTLLDKITIYETQIQADLAQNQLSKAIETALYVLKKLGINLPQTPNKIQVLLGLVKTKWILRGKKTKDLVNLPTMTHPDKLAAMRILACALSAAYIGAPKLLPLLIFQQVNLSVKYGNMPLSAFAYAWYGTILCGVVMDIDGGYEFGELALQTLEKFHAQNIRCKTVFLPNCFITHWKQHLTSTISGLRETYQTGVETGDLEYAAWSAMTMDAHLYWSGNQLSDLDETLHQYSEAIKEWKQNNPLLYNNIYHQSVYNLMGKTSQPKILDGPYYSEAQDIPVQIKTGDGAGLFFSYVNQLYLRYVFGDFSSAVEISNQALAYKDSGTATPLNVPLCLYHSLARLALCSDITKTERRSLLRQVTKNQKQLKKWADFAPMNSLHKWQLVEAEKCRVLGQKIKAIDLYDRAIAGAKENEYIQEEALAKELAAKFYLDWGKEKVAATYMQEAYYTYARWGAKAKNDELEQRYPSLLESIIEQQKLSRLNTSTIATLRMGTISQNTTGTTAILDLATVMKAFRTLSEEISLEGAIANLMQVVMENAGAETVVLMLFEKQVLMLKAMVTLKGVCQIEPIPVETSHVVPLSIINQVKHIQKTLVLENASNETAYARDAYIKQHQPQSVLCLPLLDRGKTIGILYLENNQVTGAFTQERVEVLNLLCSQAAISLENAQLYQQAQQALADQQQAQLQLVQTEKMATLGNLMAGVAHEINNPLGFVGGHVSIIQEYLPDLFTIIERYQEELPNPSDELTDQIEEIDLEFISEDLPKTIASMEMGIKRIREISTSLRTFSRTDTDTKSEFNLHDGLDSTLLILKYRLKANENRPEIEVIKNYGDLPNIQCYPGKLNQVFMNIIANAIDALDEASEGKNYADIEANNNQITISTKLITEKNMAVVEIADNGLGMSEEVRSRIFEQGFTTKGVGKGTGLGMAISQQIIVENHGGKISCRSELEKGTEFMIYLPLI